MIGPQPGWAELTGQTEEEYQGYGWASAVHPDDAQPTVDAWQQAVAAKQPFEFEHRVRRQDGAWRRFAIRAVPVLRQGEILEWVGVHIDVTDRSNAIAELTRSELRSQTILESITDGFFTLEEEWRFDYVNPEAERILNCEPGALLGRVIWEVYPGTVGTQFEQTYRRVAATRQPESFLAFYPDHGRWYDVRAFPLPTGLSVYFRDVTEAKQADELLRRNRDTFYSLIQNNPFGMYVVDADFRIAQFSQGARKAFANVQPVIGRDFAEVMRTLWPESFASEAIARFRHTLVTGEPHIAGLVERRRDVDEVEAYDWRIERVTLPDGRFGVVCHFYDLSERQELESKLRDSESRLRIATSAARLGIWTWQPEADKVSWDNERPFEIFGLDKTEGPVDAARFVSEFLHPEDVPVFQDATARTLNDGADFAFECRIRRRDGAQRWIRFTGKGASVGGAEAVQIVGTVEDITDRKAAEERVREFASKLSEADRRKDEFLATLGHELRNPLAPIGNAAALLQHPSLPGDKVTLYAQMIQRQAKAMSVLLDDLLEVTRITMGRLELKKKTVSVASLVEASLEPIRPALERKEHSLRVEMDGGEALLDVDPIRISQVLTNLLTNAIKYSERGGSIVLRTSATPENVTFEVQDTGIGLSEEQLPMVFEMFAQVAPTIERSEGGLGIGLAVAKALVELHGGRIEADSAGLGMGSRFKICVPRGKLLTPPPAAASDRFEPIRSAQEPVVVADDNLDAAESLAAVLELEGYAVHLARDGVQALALAREVNPVACFLDIGMPGLNGYEVARQLRQLDHGSAPWLVATTGWGQAEDRRRALEAGFDMHMTKPIDLNKVSQALMVRMAARGGQTG